MRKKLVYIIILLLFTIFTYHLGKQIFDSLQAGYRLDESTEDVTKLQKKNNELKKKLVEVQTVTFIEKEARDKLNLARTDETIVIVPEREIDNLLASGKAPEIKAEPPNWQGWLNLFFN